MSSNARNKRYTPKFKAIRSLRSQLWNTAKDTYSRRNSRPGQHGANTISKSAYGLQLEAKQRIKLHYGMQEKQFKNAFIKANTKRKGIKSENFIQALESRFTNIVYKSGFAPSIFAARQFISHKHFMINDKKMNIASYQLKPGDVVSCVERDASKSLVRNSYQDMSKKIKAPEYLEIDEDKLTIKFKFYPTSSQVVLPFTPDLSSVKLFYRK